jgi:hypothetical protein
VSRFLCEQDLRRRFSAEGSRGVTLEGEARCKDAFPKHVLDSALERAFRLPPLLLPVARTSCRAGATCGSSPSSRPWRQLYAPSSREVAETRKLVGLALRPEPRPKARRPPTRSGARGDEPRRKGSVGPALSVDTGRKSPLQHPRPVVRSRTQERRPGWHSPTGSSTKTGRRPIRSCFNGRPLPADLGRETVVEVTRWWYCSDHLHWRVCRCSLLKWRP